MAAEPGEGLSRYLDGEYWQLKDSLRSYLQDNPKFKLKFDQYLPEQRYVTTERAKCLFKLPEIQEQFELQANQERGFINRSLAIGEVLSATDVAVCVKMAVMAWLFGGAVLSLGSEKHLSKWFHPLKDLKFTGMFCMSEKQHGSNVRQVETEAHYDSQTQEFIINTPHESARKMYIGNALNGDYAAVFAQLIIEGKSKGPHCFIVPIRKNGRCVRGVCVHDLGLKEGLNGVDNGIISFDHVRIPRENLLNKFADVSVDGQYSTSIENDGARFNAMLAALVGTRVALSFQAITCMKVGLEIAIRYSLRRRQFGPNDGEEQLIMDYQTHQMRLMPHLATSLALTFTTRYVGGLLDEAKFLVIDVTNSRSLQAMCAGVKAYSTWQAVQTLQTCRESTGGMGYLEENRLASLKKDADVFVTFEGDNMVMLQQVAKELLAQYASYMGDNRLIASLTVLKDSMMDSIKTSRLAFSIEPVTSILFVDKALGFKESRLLRNLAKRLLAKMRAGEEAFAAWNSCLSHSTSLALCYIQRVTLQQFHVAVSQCRNKDDKKLLTTFCHLYAIHLLYEDRAWFLEHEYITPAMSKQVREQYIGLCLETRHLALRVIEAFRHPNVCVHAPIAGIANTNSSIPWLAEKYENNATSKL